MGATLSLRLENTWETVRQKHLVEAKSSQRVVVARLVLHVAVYPKTLNGKTIIAIKYNSKKIDRITKNMVAPGEDIGEHNDNTYFKYR